MSEECERGVCECESEVVSVSEWLVEREAKDSTTVCYINSSEIENDNINRNKTALHKDVLSVVVHLQQLGLGRPAGLKHTHTYIPHSSTLVHAPIPPHMRAHTHTHKYRHAHTFTQPKTRCK